jgi:hypothetical protein
MAIMTEQEAKIFLHGMFNAFNKADWDTLYKEFMWEDCLFINGEGAFSGKDHTVQYYEKMLKIGRKETLHDPFSVFVKDNWIAAELFLDWDFTIDTVYAEMPFKKGDKILLRTAETYLLRSGKAERITIYRLCPWVLTPWRDKLNEFEKIVNNVPKGISP